MRTPIATGEKSDPCQVSHPYRTFKFQKRHCASHPNSILRPYGQPPGKHQPNPISTQSHERRIDRETKRYLHHRSVGHTRMLYRDRGLKLSDLSHHLCSLSSVRLRTSSQLFVLSAQSLQLRSNVIIAWGLTSPALPLLANFRIFSILLGFASI